MVRRVFSNTIQPRESNQVNIPKRTAREGCDGCDLKEIDLLSLAISLDWESGTVSCRAKGCCVAMKHETEKSRNETGQCFSQVDSDIIILAN